MVYENIKIYIDMDGVLNRFENDPNARINMWKKNYFENIEPLEDIAPCLARINEQVDVIILSKIIDREGVIEEKNKWIDKHLGSFHKPTHSKVIYVPYLESKAGYIEDLNCLNILIDDKIKNLDECRLKNVYGIHFGNQKSNYPQINCAKSLENVLKKIISDNTSFMPE